MDELRTDRSLVDQWNLIVKEKNKKYGFGTGARLIFRAIAHKLRGFHKAQRFCGDLTGRVHITVPDLSVTFPYAPMKAGKMSLFDGIKKDIDQFRCMVGMLVRDHINSNNLSIDLKFFFSKIFIENITNTDEMLQFGMYQLFHPAFFNSDDRVRFFNFLTEYKEVCPLQFEKRMDLSDPAYELTSWDENIYDNTLWKILQKIDYTKKSNYYSTIPRFIRNVHTHYTNFDKVCIFNFVEIM